MTFHTITTFEKPGSQVEAEIWATPGWFKFSKCFMYDVSSPYIQTIESKFNKDSSYIEYHLHYFSEESYIAWHEQYKDLHDSLRKDCFANLRSRGVAIQLYWPAEELGGNEVIIPVTEFVSKITD